MSKIYADDDLQTNSGFGCGHSDGFSNGNNNGYGYGTANGNGSIDGVGNGSGTVSTGGRISNECVGVGYGIHDDLRSIGSLIMNGFHGSGRGHSNGCVIDCGCEGGFGYSCTFLIENPNNRR